MRIIQLLRFKIILVFILFIGCNQNDNRIFYDDQNQMESITNDIGNGCNSSVYFYSSGSIKEVWYICNDVDYIYNVEFYEDGILKWNGEIKNHFRVAQMPNIECIKCNIEFERDISKLTIGETYRFRLITNKIHPDDYQIRVAGGVAGKTVNDNHFDFLITPNEVGKVNIGVYLSMDFITEHPTVNICNFEFEVVQ